jgi:uncharacterized membrane protein YdjX (TVP38/TMEM64 family)
VKGQFVVLGILIAASMAGTVALVAAGGSGGILSIFARLEQHRTAALAAFALWAVLANCLVLPAGSLSLIAGGAVFGATAPAGIWFAAQLLTAPLIYRAGATSQDRVASLVARYLGRAPARLLATAARDGVWTTAVLRLTPILPSAPATLIAAGAGIELRAFLVGSAMAGWVRPLYFASLGAAAGSLAQAGSLAEALPLQTVVTLAMLFACAGLLLAARLYLRQRSL